MIQHRPSRRALASRFARGSLAYMLAKALPAHAQKQPRKLKRFVVVYMPEGPNPREWRGGSSPFALTDLWAPVGPAGQRDYAIGALSPILAGFEALKSDIFVADGTVNSRPFGDHHHGWAPVVTGRASGGGDSFDQLLAPVLRTEDRLRPSIHLGVSHGQWGVARKGGAGIAGWGSPSEAYAKLFTSFTPPVPATATPRLSEKQKQLLLTEGYVEEYKTLRALVGRVEQERIDYNLDSLEDLRKQIAATSAPSAGARCNPTVDTAATGMEKAAPQMAQIIANAFICDLTRVATLQIGHPYGDNLRYPWVGDTRGHHHWAHQLGSANAVRQPMLTKIYRWYFDQVAAIATKLKQVPEGDGTMLDSTLIITVSEFGDGHHQLSHLALLLVGGKAAGLRTGRVVRYSPNYGAGALPGNCQPINRVYLGIANHLFGLNLTTFGDADLCTAGPAYGMV